VATPALGRRECFSHGDEHAIPRRVAVAIVDLLEAIQIHDARAEGLARAATARHLLLQAVLDVAPIPASRQRILERLLRDLIVRSLESLFENGRPQGGTERQRQAGGEQERVRFRSVDGVPNRHALGGHGND
jgi:hypothetical protein